MFEFAYVLLKHRYAIIGLALASTLVVVLITLVAPPTYTASGSFIPQREGSANLGGLADVAGEFGIDVPEADPTQSPAFYTDLLRSREILGRVVSDTFPLHGIESGEAPQAGTGQLPELLGLEESRPEVRKQEAIEWLREEAIFVRSSSETAIVEVSVQTAWPRVSERIAWRLLELVNDFNLTTRQSRAAAERGFIEERLDEAETRLRGSEDELKRFLENNRQFRNSPDLVFEHDRLQRQVAMHQQLLTSLTQSYESARITEVRNTPLVTIVESPQTPPRADSKRLPLKGLLGLLIGGIAGIAYGFARELWRRGSERERDAYSDLRSVWEATLRDLRNPFRRARR